MKKPVKLQLSKVISEAYMRYTSKTDFAIGKSLPLIM